MMTLVRQLSFAAGLLALSVGCADPVATARLDVQVDTVDVTAIQDTSNDHPDVSAFDDAETGAPQDADVTVVTDADGGPQDADVTDTDGGPQDADVTDADGGPQDADVAPSIDADVTPPDVPGLVDAPDADTGPTDTGPIDTGPVDTGPVDVGPPRMTFTFVSAALSGGVAGGPQMRATITWHGMLRGENDAGVRLEAFFR